MKWNAWQQSHVEKKKISKMKRRFSVIDSNSETSKSRIKTYSHFIWNSFMVLLMKTYVTRTRRKDLRPNLWECFILFFYVSMPSLVISNEYDDIAGIRDPRSGISRTLNHHLSYRKWNISSRYIVYTSKTVIKRLFPWEYGNPKNVCALVLIEATFRS